MATWIKGTQLRPEARAEALARFVHRGTNPSYTTDEDWLAHTEFAVRKDGMLSEAARFCRSNLPRRVKLCQARVLVRAVNAHDAQREALAGLIEWAARMGGFDAPEWRRARAALKLAKGE